MDLANRFSFHFSLANLASGKVSLEEDQYST